MNQFNNKSGAEEGAPPHFAAYRPVRQRQNVACVFTYREPIHLMKIYRKITQK